MKTDPRAEHLGVAEARAKLGTLIARAVHAHRPTMISRSSTEEAVLISREEYDELQQLRHQREVAEVKEMMAKAERGETQMISYDSPEDVYHDLGIPAPSERA